ncbi:MAG: hypothetical protein ACI4IN_01170 [Eubacterium sp.]
MKLTKRDKTIKYAVYCILLLVAALLQNVQGAWPQIGGARCFFLIPVAVLLGLDEDEGLAAMIGLSAGLLWDVTSVQHMGFNAIFLMLVCYFSSSLVTYLLRATYWVGVVFGAVASLLYVVLYWLLFVVSKGGDGAFATIWYFYLPCFFYTTVMTMVLNLALILIKKKLNKELISD